MPRALRRSIDDSKALSAEERDEYARAIRRCAVIGIGAASVREIDRINILRASLLAMQRAVRALGIVPDAAPHRRQHRAGAALPGAAGDRRRRAEPLDRRRVDRRQGDARPGHARSLGRRYAGYGWQSNVGYATAEHCAALTALGATIHHRRSFAPVRVALAGGTLEPELPLIAEA